MPEESEITLYDYIKVVNKWKWFIIIGTFVCILTAGIVTLLLPKVYETRATLAMQGSVTPDVKIGILTVPSGLSLDEFFSLLPSDRDLNLKVIKDLGLDKSPDDLTPQALGQAVTFSLAKDSRTISISTRYNNSEKAKNIADAMAETVKERYQVLNESEILQSQALIEEQLKLAQTRLREAEENLESFEETVDVDSLKKEIEAIISQETSLTQEYSKITLFLVEEEAGLAKTEEELQRQLNLAQIHLLEVEKNLESFEETVDVDSLKKEIEARVSQETSLTQEYSKITLFLVEEEAGLVAAKEELQKQDRFYVLSKSIAEDPFYEDILARLSKEDIAALQAVKGESQQVNPVYLNLEQVATNARISIARAEAKKLFVKERIEENRAISSKLQVQVTQREGEREHLTEAHNLAKKLLLKAKIEENKGALNKLQARLAEKEPEWETLTEGYAIADKEYQSISNSRQAAEKSLAVAEVRQLRTVGAAGVPSSPIETKRILLIAAAVGLLAVLFLAFFLEYIGRMKKLEAESKKQGD